MKRLFFLLIVLFVFLSPVIADKSKGLFSGEILQADLDSFTSNVSENPGYLSDNQSAVHSNQDVSDWMDIGKTQLKSGNWKPAEESFSKVVDQQPANTNGWEGYLLAIRGGGDFQKLLEVSERATKENPSFASGWKYNGIALSGLDRYDEALSAFDAAINVDPKFYDAWYFKGIALDSQKKYSESVKAYENVVALNENFTKAWNNKGVALLYIGDYDKAIAAFDKALSIDPDFKKASENKGLAEQEKSKSYLVTVVPIDDAAVFIPTTDHTVIPTTSPTLTTQSSVKPETNPSSPVETSINTPQAPVAAPTNNEANLNTAANITRLDLISKSVGLISYYSFNDGKIKDEVSGNNALVSINEVVQTPWGKGISVNGANSKVEIPRLIQDDFSMLFWVKTGQISPQSKNDKDSAHTWRWWYGTPIVDGESCEVLNDFGVSLLNNQIAFGTGDKSVRDYTLFSKTKINDSLWHHVAVVRKRLTGLMEIYIDGNLEARTTEGSKQVLTSPPWIGIGINPCNEPPVGRFMGDIDEVMMYNNALSSKEISEIYQSYPKDSTCSSGNDVQLELPTPATSSTVNTNQPLKPHCSMEGCWIWMGGTYKNCFNADYTCKSYFADGSFNLDGKWSQMGNMITIDWGNGQWEDSLTLSSDCSTVDGENQYDNHVWGNRI